MDGVREGCTFADQGFVLSSKFTEMHLQNKILLVFVRFHLGYALSTANRVNLFYYCHGTDAQN